MRKLVCTARSKRTSPHPQFRIRRGGFGSGRALRLHRARKNPRRARMHDSRVHFLAFEQGLANLLAPDEHRLLVLVIVHQFAATDRIVVRGEAHPERLDVQLAGKSLSLLPVPDTIASVRLAATASADRRVRGPRRFGPPRGLLWLVVVVLPTRELPTGCAGTTFSTRVLP